MSDTIGARLRQARELRRLTLPQVSESTKVRTHYLQALENDDLSAIPSAAQARGFLHLYAEFLELDLAEITPIAAPSAAPVPEEAPATVSKPGLWAGLRGRLARSKDTAAQPDLPAVAIEPAPPPDAAAPEAPPAPESVKPEPAASEIKTARRVKAGPADVKKNAVK